MEQSNLFSLEYEGLELPPMTPPPLISPNSSAQQQFQMEISKQQQQQQQDTTTERKPNSSPLSTTSSSTTTSTTIAFGIQPPASPVESDGRNWESIFPIVLNGRSYPRVECTSYDLAYTSDEFLKDLFGRKKGSLPSPLLWLSFPDALVIDSERHPKDFAELVKMKVIENDNKVMHVLLTTRGMNDFCKKLEIFDATDRWTDCLHSGVLQGVKRLEEFDRDFENNNGILSPSTTTTTTTMIDSTTTAANTSITGNVNQESEDLEMIMRALSAEISALKESVEAIHCGVRELRLNPLGLSCLSNGPTLEVEQRLLLHPFSLSRRLSDQTGLYSPPFNTNVHKLVLIARLRPKSVSSNSIFLSYPNDPQHLRPQLHSSWPLQNNYISTEQQTRYSV